MSRFSGLAEPTYGNDTAYEGPMNAPVVAAGLTAAILGAVVGSTYLESAAPLSAAMSQVEHSALFGSAPIIASELQPAKLWTIRLVVALDAAGNPVATIITNTTEM